MLLKSMWEPANSDEEYREKLRIRRNFIPVLAAAGVLAIAASMGILRSGEEFMAGLYMGIGCGILAVSIAWFFIIRKTLRDEKKLRMKRLKESDERNIQVTLKAHYTAGAVLIMMGYVIMLISGFFSMEVFWTVWALVMLYFALFIVVRVFYDKKM